MSRSLLVRFSIGGLVFLIVMIVVSLLGSRPDAYAADGPLPPCPSDPNCARTSARVSAPAERVQTIAGEVVRSHRSWLTGRSTQGVETEDGLSAVFRVGPFRDDLQLVVEPRGESECVLYIRSASRLGRNDLGINQRRVQAVLDGISDTLKSRDPKQ